MAEAVADAGTSGRHFCEWCRDHWNVYEGTGGVCGLLSLKPVALSEEGAAELSAVLPAGLCNPLGGVHGGVTSMLLDEVGGLAVCCALGFRYLRGTSQIEVTFLKRGVPGPAVARARVRREDDVHMIAEAEVSQGDQIIARARGVYRVFAPGTAPRPPGAGQG